MKIDKSKFIPENATKAFDGKVFKVYSWQQEMFDGTFATFEKIERADTILVMIVDGENIVINHEIQPSENLERIDFVMGRVEEGEENEQTALRELKEETGIIPQKLFYVESIQLDGKILWWSHVFIAFGVKEKAPKKQDSGEKIEQKSLSFDKFYEKCKNLELTVTKKLLKVLLSENKEQFLDRFKNPGKYFEEVGF